MLVYVFTDVERKRVGFTPKSDGSNLPLKHGPWHEIGRPFSLEDWPGERFVGDPVLIFEAIERFGYYIGPEMRSVTTTRGIEPDA